MTPPKASLQPSLRLYLQGVDLASGIGQTRYNNDFGRAQDKYVTGRRSKASENSGR
jgi:hypothetical protein